MKSKPYLVTALACAMAIVAQRQAQAADGDVPLTPQTLGDALSCRSRDALEAFAGELFLAGNAPAWMHEIKDDKQTEGMLGLYGYTLAKPAMLLGEPVDRVYFLQNWVVTLWPRKKAEAFIAAHHLERAPIKATEQYYHFIDPENGPMLGAFEPTGNAMAAMLAKAFGGEAPQSAPSDSLFVGCNYAVASQEMFLDAARQSDAIMGRKAHEIGEEVAPKKP